MRKKSEYVTDISALSRSVRTSIAPLSVKVKVRMGSFNENKGVPGSFHINIRTSDKTKTSGNVYQLNNRFTGKPAIQYMASTRRYKPASRTRLRTIVMNMMMSKSMNPFVQGLIFENTACSFSL